MSLLAPVITRFSVDVLVRKHLGNGTTGDTIETAVLIAMRRREREGLIALWPEIHDRYPDGVKDATVKRDGSPGSANAVDRYWISLIADEIRRLDTQPVSLTSSSDTSCDTSDDSETKYHTTPDEGGFSFEYTPWEDVPEQEWVNWPRLFKFAAKIVHSLYGTHVHYQDFDDLMQEAWVAVSVKAIPTFNATNGAQFTTYANQVMQNHLIDVVRKMNRHRHRLVDSDLDTAETL